MKIKKFAAFCLAFAALGAVAFTGCNGEEETAVKEKKVMNLSLNPEVEFVLDSDDKVISVNALNEEGNLIVSAEVFTGKTAEEAASLFVEASKETGFLVEGSLGADENKIEISFSGDAEAATKLYNDVQAKVQEYLTAENVTAVVSQATAITEAQLETLVAECAPYIDAATIQAMEYAELMETLEKSRKETAKLYSQELKNAYYEAKAFAMEQAELEAIGDTLDAMGKIAFNTANAIYKTAVETIESTRMQLLVNENSPYQQALKAFRDAKVQYLNYREYVASLEQNELTAAISAQLAQYETLVENTETALLQAGQTANATLNSAKAQVTAAHAQVVALIDEYSAKVNEYKTEIATKQTETQTAFFTKFETDYAAAITAAENNWAAMETQLKTANGAE